MCQSLTIDDIVSSPVVDVEVGKPARPVVARLGAGRQLARLEAGHRRGPHVRHLHPACIGRMERSHASEAVRFMRPHAAPAFGAEGTTGQGEGRGAQYPTQLPPLNRCLPLPPGRDGAAAFADGCHLLACCCIILARGVYAPSFRGGQAPNGSTAHLAELCGSINRCKCQCCC